MHNSFDVKLHLGLFEATSHNFPNCVGKGGTEKDALADMDRKIIYLADNYPMEFGSSCQERAKHGLECACGVKLKEAPLGIYRRK